MKYISSEHFYLTLEGNIPTWLRLRYILFTGEKGELCRLCPLTGFTHGPPGPPGKRGAKGTPGRENS